LEKQLAATALIYELSVVTRFTSAINDCTIAYRLLSLQSLI